MKCARESSLQGPDQRPSRNYANWRSTSTITSSKQKRKTGVSKTRGSHNRTLIDPLLGQVPNHLIIFLPRIGPKSLPPSSKRVHFQNYPKRNGNASVTLILALNADSPATSSRIARPIKRISLLPKTPNLSKNLKIPRRKTLPLRIFNFPEEDHAFQGE